MSRSRGRLLGVLVVSRGFLGVELELRLEAYIESGRFAKLE